MSLASLLLADAASAQALHPTKAVRPVTHVDEDLDALFRSNVEFLLTPTSVPNSSL